MRKNSSFDLSNLKYDLPGGIVVFLVAVPLCLGIALACGLPLFSGILAGIIGGLVVSWASGSQLSVSGPAAGLIVIVVDAIAKLGGHSYFLTAVVLAGIIQIVLGFIRAGALSAYFPNAVIKGMLAAIGLILIFNQFPVLLGILDGTQKDEQYGFVHQPEIVDKLLAPLNIISLGPVIVALGALIILFLWDSPRIKQHPWLKNIPGAVVAVGFGLVFSLISPMLPALFHFTDQHRVSLPVLDQPSDIFNHFVFPTWQALANPDIYLVAFTLAIVASLESLLSLEAVNKLDPQKRLASPNRELKAQGLGNLLSGMIGGLPITAVIVRSATNVTAGSRTKLASFIHGLLLLASVLFAARYLNLIPLAALAAVLTQVGYKLAKPHLFKEAYAGGMNVFLPFVLTILAILLTDLLIGIVIGIMVGLLFVLLANMSAAITQVRDNKNVLIRCNKDITFLHKPILREMLRNIEAGSSVVIDGRRANYIAPDILEEIEEFIVDAPRHDIRVELMSINCIQVVYLPQLKEGHA
jgi:MFS superfamily sulfate permease-like transporter